MQKLSKLATFDDARKRLLYTPEFAHTMRDCRSLDIVREVMATTGASNGVDAALGTDVASYLADDLLGKSTSRRWRSW